MAEKDKKAKKKENFIQRWYRETSGELRKVNWPTLPEARRLTIYVLITMAAMGIFLAGVDFLGDQLISLILGL